MRRLGKPLVKRLLLAALSLGIIVAMYRNRLPIDVDEMSELRG